MNGSVKNAPLPNLPGVLTWFMTQREFEEFRLAIESKPFVATTTGPFGIGIERRVFEKHKLERLVAAARTCSGTTARRKIEVYERKLKRFQVAQQRFEKLQAEMRSLSDIARLRGPTEFQQQSSEIATP